MVFQIQEVVAVDQVQAERGIGGEEYAVADEGLSVVALQLLVVGQRRSVGIEDAVGAFVAVHLETAIGRGEHPLLVAILLT